MADLDRRVSDASMGSDIAEESVELTVILPAYNEEDSVFGIVSQIEAVLGERCPSYEILFVDDGSTDQTWPRIKELAARDPRIRAIKHRRNFGKASALANGFTYARGDIMVTTDADMQYDPNDIVRLVEKVREGFEVVSAYKVVRRDPLSRRIASGFFNFFVRNTTGVRLHDFNAGLKAYKRCAARDLVRYGYGELHRFFILLAARRGFCVAEVPVESLPRPSGKSKYGLERYMRGALDYLTVFFLAGYAERPLHLLGSLGLWLGGIGTVALASAVYLEVARGASVAAGTLLAIAVLLMLSGMQLIVVGLMTEMINNLERGSSNASKISKVIRIDRRASILLGPVGPMDRSGIDTG